jgi:hypothetical protein
VLTYGHSVESVSSKKILVLVNRSSLLLLFTPVSLDGAVSITGPVLLTRQIIIIIIYFGNNLFAYMEILSTLN